MLPDKLRAKRYRCGHCGELGVATYAPSPVRLRVQHDCGALLDIGRACPYARVTMEVLVAPR